MGIITLTLIAVGLQPSGSGPELWVVAVCGLAIAAGTYMGGWRVIRTLGKGLTEISTPQGFAAEAAAQPPFWFPLTSVSRFPLRRFAPVPSSAPVLARRAIRSTGALPAVC